MQLCTPCDAINQTKCCVQLCDLFLFRLRLFFYAFLHSPFFPQCAHVAAKLARGAYAGPTRDCGRAARRVARRAARHTRHPRRRPRGERRGARRRGGGAARREAARRRGARGERREASQPNLTASRTRAAHTLHPAGGDSPSTCCSARPAASFFRRFVEYPGAGGLPSRPAVRPRRPRGPTFTGGIGIPTAPSSFRALRCARSL